MSAAVSTPQPPAVRDASLDAAAQWLATGGADKNLAVVPQLRSRFGLSAIAAVAAIRESNLIRARAL